MSLPSERQEALNPIFAKLSELKGIVGISQENFDNQSVTLLLKLEVEIMMTDRFGERPEEFTVRISTIKLRIRAICKKYGIKFDFLDGPLKQYFSDGYGGDIPDGYLKDTIKVQIFV